MGKGIDVVRAGLQTDCCEEDPHVAGNFHLEAAIANGTDLSTYMVNDLGEILINNDGSLLTE